MKKLIVNTDGCIGCGACIGIDPEHFDFDEKNLSHVISQDNLESETLQEAIEACPVSVIYFEEKSTEIEEETHEKNLNNRNCHNEDCECIDCKCIDSECEN